MNDDVDDGSFERPLTDERAKGANDESEPGAGKEFATVLTSSGRAIAASCWCPAFFLIHMQSATASAEEDRVPIGHVGGPPLYGKMMAAIRSGHSFGNGIRMLKLPLIFTEPELYAGAIAQFYHLSSALEAALRRHNADPMVSRVMSLGLNVTPGYEADLQELYGKEEWTAKAESAKTKATSSYVKVLEESSPVELVAAAFILYGALVVGGGKMTQQKVRKVFPSCSHALFDVAPDMTQARASFKACFTSIGKDFPQHFEQLERDSARFMSMNNQVVISIRCVGRRVAVGGALLVGVASLAIGMAIGGRRVTR